MDPQVQPTPFFHVELAGEPYEIGRQQGELVAAIPAWKDFIASGRGAFQASDFKQALAAFDRYCPGLNAEIHGLADAAHLAVEDVIYYSSTYLRAGCSHLAVLPKQSENGHVLVARSYDFSDSMDDMRLCTTRPTGKYAHIGFSTMLFGRNDGMNEHGLSVTTSSGGIPVGPTRPPIQTGFQFWALVRAILENCQDVEEALQLAAAFPLACNAILILADRSGQAALVECYGPKQAVRRIGPAASEQHLLATNHYTLPEMLAYQTGRMENSIQRAATIQTFLEQRTTALSKEDLKHLLASPYPQGLCCHYYNEYFGTLHALVMDLTEQEMEVCFGSPNVNPWVRVDFKQTPASQPYASVLPRQSAPDGFYQMI